MHWVGSCARLQLQAGKRERSTSAPPGSEARLFPALAWQWQSHKLHTLHQPQQWMPQPLLLRGWCTPGTVVGPAAGMRQYQVQSLKRLPTGSRPYARAGFVNLVLRKLVEGPPLLYKKLSQRYAAAVKIGRPEQALDQSLLTADQESHGAEQTSCLQGIQMTRRGCVHWALLIDHNTS